MNLHEALNWRYATKRMNGQKIEAAKADRIIESIRLSASSLGLQPYHIFVIEDKALLTKIHENACKQPQILEASHVVVFAAWADFSDSKMDAYMQQIAAERNVPLESLKGFEDNIKGMLKSKSVADNTTWAAKQTYIALGFGLVAAALEQIDATPMEGFNPAALDEVLGLKEKGLQSTVILSLGYRDEANDYLAKAKKIRRKKEDLITSL
jgi:nitroreductase/dihydropteridine reductase